MGKKAATPQCHKRKILLLTMLSQDEFSYNIAYCQERFGIIFSRAMIFSEDKQPNASGSLHSWKSWHPLHC